MTGRHGDPASTGGTPDRSPGRAHRFPVPGRPIGRAASLIVLHLGRHLGRHLGLHLVLHLGLHALSTSPAGSAADGAGGNGALDATGATHARDVAGALGAKGANGEADAAGTTAFGDSEDSGLLELLEAVDEKDWETALPGLRSAADTVSGRWIAEVHAGLAYAALANADPAEAWRQLETGRLRYLAWALDLVPETDAHPPIPLEELKVRLSGAKATLLAFGDSRILAPICMVIHEDGEHAFAIGSERLHALLSPADSRGAGDAGGDARDAGNPRGAGDAGGDARDAGNPRGAGDAGQAPMDPSAASPPRFGEGGDAALLGEIVRIPWSRIPPTTERLFLQPPLALWHLSWADTPIPREGNSVDTTLGQRYPLSYLPWSTTLSWASAPRTRSGDGLVILGGEDDDALHRVLGGRPRAAPIPATLSNLEATGPKADVIDLRARAPLTSSWTPGPSSTGRAALHLDDGDWGPAEIASIGFLADAVILAPGRVSGDAGAVASGFLAGGARSVFTLAASLPDSTAEAIEHELFLRLRRGVPRDQAVAGIYRFFEELGRPLDPGALHLYGPGHLPVYALTAKRGIGMLLLSWALFLGTGFFMLRFFVRRFIKLDTAGPE